MMSEHSDLILAHYGVKGMKWDTNYKTIVIG